jgi:enterochelin esterase-like enzyme
LWTAAGLTPQTPAPLIVAHDGPEYARLAGLTRFLEAEGLPPVRAALLQPRARNEDYSASTHAADGLANELMPDLERRFATTTRIGLGASLGGLALLHAHRRHPHLFSALVLQSGSFFQRELDVHEHRFSRFERIDAFVREVATTPGRPIPVMLTCGSAEENLANNQAMERVLRAQGYAVELHTVRDGHTWTCWRDTLAQSLGALLAARAASGG